MTYHAVMQDHFTLSYRDLRDKLRERIASCDAVIHIAGQWLRISNPKSVRRGRAPQFHADGVRPGRKTLGKPVYVLLTGADFPCDPHDPEPDELRQLQEQHRQRLTSTGQDYKGTNTREDLDREVRSGATQGRTARRRMTYVDQKVTVTGRRLGRLAWPRVRRWESWCWPASVWFQRQQQIERNRAAAERIAQQQEREKQDRERASQELERPGCRSRTAAGRRRTRCHPKTSWAIGALGDFRPGAAVGALNNVESFEREPPQ